MKQKHKNTKECDCGRRHWQSTAMCSECHDAAVNAVIVRRGPKEDAVIDTFAHHRDGEKRKYER